MNRALCAYIDQAFVGTLSENAGVWSFQYDEKWITEGHELSPGLPLTAVRHEDGGTVRPVQWFFDNLLPEEGARIQLMKYMRSDVTMGVDAWSMLAHFEPQWPDIAMSYPIASVVHYGELRKTHVEEFAHRLGIRASSFNREFNRMVGGIEEAALELENEFQARTDVPANYRASQTRMLRCIRFLPIATMVKQLGQAS